MARNTEYKGWRVVRFLDGKWHSVLYRDLSEAFARELAAECNASSDKQGLEYRAERMTHEV